MWSLFNHHSTANQLWYDALNQTPGRVGPEIGRPPEDPVTYFRDWLANDGAPFWSVWENARSWWAIRDLPNVHFVHFADLKADMAGEMRKIAAVLDITPSDWQTVLDHCTFDYMQAHAQDCVPLGGAFWGRPSCTRAPTGAGRACCPKPTARCWRHGCYKNCALTVRPGCKPVALSDTATVTPWMQS
jgi:aryl sulfotransferase